VSADRDLCMKAILAEYESLKNDLRKQVSDRMTMTSIMISASGIVFAQLFVSGWTLFLPGVFGIALAWVYLLTTSYRIHFEISKYIRDEIEKTKIPKLIQNSEIRCIYWESHCYDDLRREIGPRLWIHKLFVVGVYLLCGFLLSLPLLGALSFTPNWQLNQLLKDVGWVLVISYWLLGALLTYRALKSVRKIGILWK